jgi:hypothetical protein
MVPAGHGPAPQAARVSILGKSAFLIEKSAGCQPAAACQAAPHLAVVDAVKLNAESVRYTE